MAGERHAVDRFKSKDAAMRCVCDSLWSKRFHFEKHEVPLSLVAEMARIDPRQVARDPELLESRCDAPDCYVALMARARARPTRVRRLDRARRFVLERTRARRCSHPRALAARGGSDHSPRLSLSGTA